MRYALFQSDSEYEGPVSITLFHSTNLGPETEWSERGHIIIQNVVTGDMSVSQKSVDSPVAKSLLVGLSSKLFVSVYNVYI